MSRHSLHQQLFLGYGAGRLPTGASIACLGRTQLQRRMSESPVVGSQEQANGAPSAAEPRPAITWSLIAANLVVFAALTACGLRLRGSPAEDYLRFGVNFAPFTTNGEWWRLLTATFVHLGVIHLALNLWALWESGRIMEKLYGHVGFAAIYLLAGICGSVASMLWRADAINAGASGAVFGLLGALVVSFGRDPELLPATALDHLRLSVAAFAVYSVYFGFQQAGIDNAAHIGGLLSGTLAAAALAKPSDAAASRYRRVPLLAAGTLACCILALVASIPAPLYRWSEEKQAEGEIKEFIGDDAKIVAQWNLIMGNAQKEGASFDQLAGQIESEVSSQYADSFDQLAKLRLSPAAPSAMTLETLRNYAAMRRDASRELVEGLRANDPERIQKALELASKASEQVGEKATPSGPAKR